MSDTIAIRSCADALQEGHSIDRHVTAKMLHDAAAEIERLNKVMAVKDEFIHTIDAVLAELEGK